MENTPPQPATPPEAFRKRTSPAGRLLRRTLRWALYAALFFVVSTTAAVLLYRFVPPPATPLMILRLWDQYRAGEPVRLDKDWRPLDEISPWLAASVIASEDQRFFSHNGFDFEAIEKARQYNERMRARGRTGRLRGASTISQQTAKNVFLWPARSWTRKGLEVWFTFLIETLWPKQRILEVYVNVAEMGNGIYGAQAAARSYYGRDARRLTRAQAAMIAAILPRPRAWSPLAPPRRVVRRQAWILRQLPAIAPSFGLRAPAWTPPPVEPPEDILPPPDESDGGPLPDALDETMPEGTGPSDLPNGNGSWNGEGGGGTYDAVEAPGVEPAPGPDDGGAGAQAP